MEKTLNSPQRGNVTALESLCSRQVSTDLGQALARCDFAAKYVMNVAVEVHNDVAIVWGSSPNY